MNGRCFLFLPLGPPAGFEIGMIFFFNHQTSSFQNSNGQQNGEVISVQLLGSPWISYACSSMSFIALKKLPRLVEGLCSNLACFDRRDRTTYFLVVLCSCPEKNNQKTLPCEGLLVLKRDFHLNRRI